VSRGWKIALVIWGAFWAVIVVAATVPADAAVRNLASWADALGLVRIADWFSTQALEIWNTISPGLEISAWLNLVATAAAAASLQSLFRRRS
jgi:hypothetical protein